MARKFVLDVECECGMKNPAEFPKPNYFKPVAIKFCCPDCKSEMNVVVKKNSITGSTASLYRTMTKESDLLRLLKMEDAQEARENA